MSSGMLFAGRAPQVERFPLRQSFWLALGELAGRFGSERLARKCGAPLGELDQIIGAKLAPDLGARSRIIAFLIKGQHVVPPRGDAYAPDGTEFQYGLSEPAGRARRAMRSQFPDRDRD
jgi:hypothetical protein